MRSQLRALGQRCLTNRLAILLTMQDRSEELQAWQASQIAYNVSIRRAKSSFKAITDEPGAEVYHQVLSL